MKKRLLGMLLGLLLIIGMTQSAHAFGYEDWWFDIDGAGGNAATQIHEYIGITSPNFVDTEFNGPNLFTFDNVGVVKAIGHDGGLDLPVGWQLTGIYSFNGNGELGADLTFTGGQFDLYVNNSGDWGDMTKGVYGSNNGTHIASFDLDLGSGTLQPSGLPNGDISISYTSSFLAADYFFYADGTTDMASNGVMSYTTTNASHITNPVPALAEELLGFAGYVGDPANAPPDDFFLSSGGQFRINPVPVPPALFLLGSGLAALFGIRRKKS